MKTTTTLVLPPFQAQAVVRAGADLSSTVFRALDLERPRSKMTSGGAGGGGSDATTAAMAASMSAMDDSVALWQHTVAKRTTSPTLTAYATTRIQKTEAELPGFIVMDSNAMQG